MTDPLRAHWGRLIGATLVVIAGAFVLPHVVPVPTLLENRRLAEAPALPADLSGLTAYRRATDAYVADHFPPRTHLIGALNTLRLWLGVSGSSRVIVGHDSWLFSDNGSHLSAARGDPAMSNAEARAWLGGLASRTEALKAEGRTYVVLVAPVKETVYPGAAPDWFALDFNRRAAMLNRLAAASGAGDLIYPQEALAQQARWGLRVYDRYDSHWSGLGAYQAYVALMRRLERQGVTEGPRPLESFAERTDMPDSAKAHDLALMLGAGSFVKVRFPEFTDPAAVERLRIAYLDPARRDWTGLRVIDTGQTGKPVLLITVDSFSNALLPFLYGHFSRIVTAHNDQGVWRRDLIDRFQPDVVAIETLENGAALIMGDTAAPSADARARIARAVARRRAYAVVPPHDVYGGERRMVEGGEGDDKLKGSRRADDIQGRPGNDSISGLGGDDILRGGRGRDTLDGGPGNDWLSGGRDADILRGGPGADVFNSFEEAGVDQVMDFNAADGDRVEIAAGAAYTVRQVGPDVVVTLRDASLILRGVALIDLPNGWIRNK
ncbi:MAG: hypothetical protein KKE02_05265 [Alphaproteobacteria bacterium]|nr:hypothetical protein [Alphaproteobacteria bacterium]MBU1516308.1 hypothetical protein [Alphaproteobacteria bacterium]MBU2093148.1 hypothetical protein [Alphaproteobacteria bacterium]MBU2150408.1 hypothetical protein [Alphaproteobacteria bacterium]MBU2308784.1 hypothetical protein [Alphaproteobacteria bacterium]